MFSHRAFFIALQRNKTADCCLLETLLKGGKKMHADRLLTDIEASEYLGIATSTMRVWRWKKTGPRYHKISRCVRYSRADLDSFISESRIAR